MEKKSKLPFKVGDLAEERSFLTGYRGAWFQCKITGISKRGGHTVYMLQYDDYPGQKLSWTLIYKVPAHYFGKGKDKHRELVIRPRYPPIYNEKQMPDAGMISEVTVIVDNSWKVGDLVDWLKDACFWSGRIVQLLGDDMAKIELLPPPHGEGSTYEAHFKDIRPSLDWSPESGWTVPTQVGGNGHSCGNGRSCARLIKPVNPGGQETESVQVTAGPSVGLSLSSPVSSLAVSDEIKSTATVETTTKNQTLVKSVPKETNGMQEKSTSRGCGADTDSLQTSAETTTEVAQNDQKYGGSGGITLNSTHSDTLEAAVLDLEEYASKIKWVKGILQYGISSTHAPRPQWEFVGPK